MEKIQHIILKWIENEDHDEDKFNEKIVKIKNIINIQNKSELTTVLHIINSISQYHARTKNFIKKFEMLLKSFQNEILKYFTNNEIFNIFINNKRILLFLFKEKILIPNQSLVNRIVETKKYDDYCEYFYPEFKDYYDESFTNLIRGIICEYYLNNLDLFEKNREIGENDLYICQLLRNDLLDDFIIYVNKNNINLSSKLEPSIFETNDIIIGECLDSLIEYAAFFGSIQIVEYLYRNDANISKTSFIIAVLASNSPDLIYFYEDKFGFENDLNIYEYFSSSLMLHHNDIALYILNNYMNIEKINIIDFLMSYNFIFIQKLVSEIFYLECFITCCKYDYSFVVDFILNSIGRTEYIGKFHEI